MTDPDEVHFKSPLDAEIAKHGRRYGFLVHFVNEALKHGLANVRGDVEKALEHANRDGWVGLEWEGHVS
jgi:hypothetical protein